MLRGYRSIILALVGWLILAGNTQPVSQSSRSDSPTAQSNERASKDTPVASALGRIGSALEAQNAKTDPYEKERNQREVRDLQAQENSAYWAEAMFWATAVAVILSVIGLFLIYTTYQATKKSNDITREIGQSQVRAYLSIDSAEIIFNNGLPLIRLTISNKGQSPSTAGTFKFIPNIHYIGIDVDAVQDRLKIYDFEMSGLHIGSLAPNESRPDLVVGFKPKMNEIENLPAFHVHALNPASHFKASGEFFLEWTDVFGVECDSSGFMIADTFHKGDDRQNIICSSQCVVKTSVYDTTAWFKRWQDKQKKKG